MLSDLSRLGVFAITVVGFFLVLFPGVTLLQESLTGEATPLPVLCIFSALVKYMTAI